MAGTRKFPSDLLLVAVLVILMDIFAVIPALSGSSNRTALGLSIVLFLSGYVLIDALFPAKSNIDRIERVAFSFGLNSAVVLFIGFGLKYASWKIRILPILISLSSFIIFICGLFYLRRTKLPEADAFELPFREMTPSPKAEILEKPKSKLDKALTVFLTFSIRLSVLILIYIILTPKEGKHFIKFHILEPEGKADNYPTKYLLGVYGTVIVGIVNHEYRSINYIMDLRLDNNSLPLSEKLEQITLDHNETLEEPLQFMPLFEEKDMKLGVLSSMKPTKKTPCKDFRLWINVTEEA